MRVVYADPGLHSEMGHHATSCRLITAALRARGHDVGVATWDNLPEPLRSEFAARPVFRINTYHTLDTDPICGWLVSYFSTAQVTAADFARLGPFDPGDLLYVNSVLPAQLAAIHTFLAGLPPAARPQTVVELGTDPGVEFRIEGANVVLLARDPRIDARATLYRLVGRQMGNQPVPQLHLCTFDRTSSDVYAALLLQPVATLPLPQGAAIAPRLRGGADAPADEPRTVAVIGHQRTEKGYHFMPAVAEALLLLCPDIRLLVHNAEPGRMPAVQEAMRRLAADKRIELNEQPAGPWLWRSLLDRADLILCPYLTDRFRAGYSAVASEAIACGIPLVVPEHTTLARLMRDFESGGTTFDGNDVAVMVDAVVRALADFDTHAARALQASGRWSKAMGSDAMVDAMLALAAAAAMEQRAPDRLAA